MQNLRIRNSKWYGLGFEQNFTQGAKENDQYAMQHEKPSIKYLSMVFIDIHEVTNKEFRAFVNATNYKTVAERPIDWEAMKKQLAPYAKPADSVFNRRRLINRSKK